MTEPPPSLDTPGDGRKISALAALTALGNDLVGPIPPDQVAERVAETLHALLAPDHVAIWLVDERGASRISCCTGVANGEPEPALMTLTLVAGPTVIPNDVASRLAVRGITLDHPPASWLGCPMVADAPLGAISLSAQTPNRFAAGDLELVQAVAKQAAIALENKQLLAMLSAGKREWEQTVDAIRLGICVVDTHGAVRRANRAFSGMVDVPLTDIAGQACMALVPPTWADAVSAALDHPAQTETAELHAGTHVFHLSALSLTGTRAGGVALIFDDQTERRRLQDQLIQSEKMSAIGQLIAGVAHDLNNPLASVIGFSDYLVESGTANTPALSEPLRAIQQEAERAANIVRNLLSFARKQEHQRRDLSIRQLLTSTLALLKNQLMANRIDSELSIPSDLPRVNVDPSQVQQVFLNLISNAAQAIGAAGSGGRITIRGERWLDGVAVTVEDSGPGVPEPVEGRIFEPFFTTKPEGEGTGLGLSICQGIIKEHGGRLSYARSPLGGAAFRVEIPAGEAVATPRPTPTRTPGVLRILVIDDEPHIQHYMQATLEAWGHEVAIAADGAEGLYRALNEQYDMIISDLRMPELGGREMFDALQRDRPDVAGRVVFSTGDTVRGDTMAFLESLGRPFLRKPFSLAELRSVIAQIGSP